MTAPRHRLRRADRIGDERGQVLIIAVLCMSCVIAITGFVIDVAQMHMVQRNLQIAADAAALAGATGLPTGSSATANALSYDASAAGGSQTSAGKNVFGFSVSTATSLGCLSARTVGTSSISCTPNSGNGQTPFSPACTSQCNAIRVTETASVQPWFMSILGIGARTVTATATASQTGGIPTPLDVEVIIDTTASMGDADTCTVSEASGTNISRPTQEDCAKQGVSALLGSLLPCNQGLSTCGAATNGNVANPVDRAGLMVFPALNFSGGFSQGSSPWTGVPAETNCTGNEVSGHVTYTNSTNVNSSGYSNYQVIPFSSDYRTSDTTASSVANDPALALNSASNLTKAVYWYQCPSQNYPGDESYGVEDPGGVGTFYGDVLADAKSTLSGSNGRGSSVHQAIVLLSDGDANATSGNMSGSTTDPSGTNECQDGITQAEAAENSGIEVFSVAYGALTSGCSTDSYSSSTCNASTHTYTDCTGGSPLCAMVMIADNSVTNPSAYSNDAAALAGAESAGCNSNANMVSIPAFRFYNTPTGASLQGNFQSVGNALTSSRLISDNAT